MIERQRPCAIFIKNNKIFIIKRIKNDKIYYVFPGGHVENDENLEETLKREIKEELNFEISSFREVFRIIEYNPGDNCQVENVFYLIEGFIGNLKLGGPEIERMKNGNNEYHLMWYSKSEFEQLNPIYPAKIKELVLKKLLQ